MKTLFDVPVRRSLYDIIKKVKQPRGKKRPAYKGVIKLTKTTKLPVQKSLFDDKNVP